MCLGDTSWLVKEVEKLLEMLTSSGDRIGIVLEKEAISFFLWKTQC